MAEVKADQRYPKCKYHAQEPARLVESELAEAELGEGWGDHPKGPFVNQAMKKPEPEKVPEKPAKPAEKPPSK